MKKMSKGMLMAALICGVVQWGGTPVNASELQEFALDEYVVTAARTETKLVDTSANISVVDAQTIEERHYQDVSEVLKDVPGANVMDTGHGASEKVIKLNGDERVLVLVDGRKANLQIGSTSGGRANFDMNQLPDVGLIERIEVLKGAGGALYGSDAVGGVVNIITKKADRNYGKVSLGVGSFGEKDMSAMYSIKEGKTGVNVAVSRNEKDYYKYRDVKSDTTKRWPGKSDYKNEKVSLKLEQELNTNSNLLIGYDYSKFEGNSPTNIVENWNPNTDQAYLDKKSQSIYAKYDWFVNENDAGYLQVYHNELEYSNAGFMEEKTNGIDAQQEFSLSNSNKLVIGASWSKSDVKTVAEYVGMGNQYDESVENLAFFINDNWEFIPTWTLNAGIRYDDHSVSGDETTLSAGLNKKFNDYSHAYFNWGQVFKAPTTDDLYYNIPGGEKWGGMYGDENLKPETGDTWTLGYQTKINNTDVGINYFESDLDDAIAWDWGNGMEDSRVRNVNKQKKRGMELTLNHELNGNVDIIASYTYLKVENDEGIGYVRDWNYMPNTYRMGVHYNDGKWDSNIWLRAGSGGATHVYNYSQSYVDSSYWTVDMAITYKATKDLSFYAKGYNLFNEAYADYAGVNSSGSYKYPAQSRRFIVGAEYKF
ncbi:MAG: TonB-dependent receptor [Phascolarctobacterium sp.]|nr:TonB-dependent receptor [Phascolarctobacterium sp.]